MILKREEEIFMSKCVSVCCFISMIYCVYYFKVRGAKFGIYLVLFYLYCLVVINFGFLLVLFGEILKNKCSNFVFRNLDLVNIKVILVYWENEMYSLGWELIVWIVKLVY